MQEQGRVPFLVCRKKKQQQQRGVLLSKVEGNYVSFGTFGMPGGLEFKLSVLTASSG